MRQKVFEGHVAGRPFLSIRRKGVKFAFFTTPKWGRQDFRNHNLLVSTGTDVSDCALASTGTSGLWGLNAEGKFDWDTNLTPLYTGETGIIREEHMKLLPKSLQKSRLHRRDSVVDVALRVVEGEAYFEYFRVERGECSRSLRLLEAHYGKPVAGLFYSLGLKLSPVGEYEVRGESCPLYQMAAADG